MLRLMKNMLSGAVLLLALALQIFSGGRILVAYGQTSVIAAEEVTDAGTEAIWVTPYYFASGEDAIQFFFANMADMNVKEMLNCITIVKRTENLDFINYYADLKGYSPNCDMPDYPEFSYINMAVTYGKYNNKIREIYNGISNAQNMGELYADSDITPKDVYDALKPEHIKAVKLVGLVETEVLNNHLNFEKSLDMTSYIALLQWKEQYYQILINCVRYEEGWQISEIPFGKYEAATPDARFFADSSKIMIKEAPLAVEKKAGTSVNLFSNNVFHPSVEDAVNTYFDALGKLEFKRALESTAISGRMQPETAGNIIRIVVDGMGSYNIIPCPQPGYPEYTDINRIYYFDINSRNMKYFIYSICTDDLMVRSVRSPEDAQEIKNIIKPDKMKGLMVTDIQLQGVDFPAPEEGNWESYKQTVLERYGCLDVAKVKVMLKKDENLYKTELICLRYPAGWQLDGWQIDVSRVD